MEINNKRRILIIGNSCSGKSTFARKISGKLNVKHYDLDDLYFEEKYSKKRYKKECKILLSKIVQKESWVIEGVYISWTKEARDSADLIIFLDIPLRKLLINAFHRWRESNKKYGQPLKEFFIHIHYIISYYTKKGGYDSKVERTKKFLNGCENKTIIVKSKKQLNKLLL